MLSETIEQAGKQIEKSQSLLIVFKNDLTGDSLCAAVGLASALTKAGKKVELIAADGLSDKFVFLPGSQTAKVTPGDSEGTLVFRIKNGRAKISELWYDQKGEELQVFISPKVGLGFRRSDVEIGVEGGSADLLVCVGLAAPEQAGKIFESNAALFFGTPILNIDISSANEGYGAINLIDLTASSNSEIVFELISLLDKTLISGDAATALLAGLVAKTDSFQSLKTTPRSLFAASRLLENGADHQNIVRNLYKTKTFGLLKLWGRALARLNMHSEHQFIISCLTASDLSEAKAGQGELEHVVEELAATLSDARIIVLLAEIAPEKTCAYVFAKPQLNLEEFLLEFRAGRTKPGLASFEIAGQPFSEAVKIIENRFIDWLKSIEQV